MQALSILIRFSYYRVEGIRYPGTRRPRSRSATGERVFGLTTTTLGLKTAQIHLSGDAKFLAVAKKIVLNF